MATINLVFDGKRFPVPKKYVFQLLEHHNLFQAKTYAVQSPVPRDIFERFVNSLKAQTKISVTKEDAASLSLLANEFFLPELAAECAAFSVWVDGISSLSDRVSQLELQVSSFSNRPSHIDDEIGAQERELETLRRRLERQRDSFYRKVGRAVSRIDDLRSEFDALRGDVNTVKDSAGGEIGQLKLQTERVAQSVSGLEILRPEFDGLKLALQRLQEDFAGRDSDSETLSEEVGQLRISVDEIRVLTASSGHRRRHRTPDAGASPVPLPPPAKRHEKIEFPMKEGEALDGIISYLTQIHGGNVHEKGIVTITSKSVSDCPGPNRSPGAPPHYGAQRVADFDSKRYFQSKDKPGQWICWDFREMRVRPTHYTIASSDLLAWIVEGSTEGRSWTEIRTGRVVSRSGNRTSFALSNSAEFRFIRLTQTDKNQWSDDRLVLSAVEFFGALSE